MATRVIEGRLDATSFKMEIDKDVEIPLRDGAVVRADVYRPVGGSARNPVLMTYGPYGKDSHISQFMGDDWEKLRALHPEITGGTSAKYMVFERPNPEQWVPHGYAVAHVDCRGAGRSPGKLNVNSPQEFRDFHDAIEWAGAQPWCNGKVGLLGISYYAAGQWMVASYRPKYLAALLPSVGTCDFYRDRTRHGGIFCSGFVQRWWTRSVLNNQHGNAATRLTDFIDGKRSTGDVTLTPEQLAANREEYIDNVRAHPLLDAWYRERSADLSKIEVPALVISNWSGLGLHLRGTIEGFVGIASKQKWLKVQHGPYFATFFAPESVAFQRRFFDRFLKDIDNGWEAEPRVELTVRRADGGVHRILRAENWPVPGTEYVKFHLDASNRSLGLAPSRSGGQLTYAAMSEGATFTSDPIDRDLEIVGPMKAKLQVSSSLPDMDLFCTVLAFDRSGQEISFASNMGFIPVSQGWLRVTQRKLDPKRSSDWQPVHSHDERMPLEPGERVECEVEIWPTGVYLPRGSRLALVLQGKDFEGLGQPRSSTSSIFRHVDPVDRPQDRYSGEHTVYTGSGGECYLQVPIIVR